MTTGDAPLAASTGQPDQEERHKLTTLSGLAALSLDALSSVAYGPEAIVIVLVAAGTAGLAYTLPVTLAIVILLTALVISYRQVIAAIAIVIVSGLLRSHPVVAPERHLPGVAESVGALLLLRAFASGCSALTGAEAIANAVPSVLLGLAANNSFGGLPVLASLLARDNFLPHLFFLRADRQVHRYGVLVLAVFAAILLVLSGGNTQRLVPLFAIGVFVGFTLSQAGMVRHWREQRGAGWAGRATINGIGAVLTFAALVIELASKFTEGAWLVALVVPLLVLMFSRVHATYDRIGRLLELGSLPPRPEPSSALVVVPVGGISRLTQEGMSAALSLGDEVLAVTVSYNDPDDEAVDTRLREQWDEWNPGVRLITLQTVHRSLGPPIVEYLRQLEATDRYHRIVVLIPEVQPARPWQRILHNQRGFVLDRAIQKGTVNVVICRLHFQLATWSPSATLISVIMIRGMTTEIYAGHGGCRVIFPVTRSGGFVAGHGA